MDVIIFSGQSNMQGQTDCLSENQVVQNAFEYKWLTDELAPLKNPVGEDITYDLTKGCNFDGRTISAPDWRNMHVTGSACYGHTNLVPAFCRKYLSSIDTQVTAVHVAKGSTTISNWLPNQKAYQVLVEKSCSAIKKVNPTNVYFVWLQGESDAIESTSKNQYKQHLTTLCNALKKDVGIKKFGIIRVGKFTNDQRDLEIISAQDEICKENKDFVMLTDIATDLNQQSQYMNPSARGHFNAKGLELLGESAAQGLVNLILK
jgi:hypothetical protein